MASITGLCVNRLPEDDLGLKFLPKLPIEEWMKAGYGLARLRRWIERRNALRFFYALLVFGVRFSVTHRLRQRFQVQRVQPLQHGDLDRCGTDTRSILYKEACPAALNLFDKASDSRSRLRWTRLLRVPARNISFQGAC